MPIYEFYCPSCNTIFSFFSAGVAPKTKPRCPRDCGGGLEKRPSTFATPKRRESDDEPTPFDDLDESRMEGAFAALAGEMEGLEDSEDPRVVSRALRRFGELTGLELGPRMQDALARLEGGEDLDQLEEEFDRDLGEDSDDDLSEFFRLKKAMLKRRARPNVDPELYFLED